VLAHQDPGEAEPLHEAVEDERAAADHVDAARVHHPDGGAFGPRLDKQPAGHGTHIGRGGPGVVDQGGDGYGAAQAFAAASRKEPIIIMGNRQDELEWWKEQKAKNGYTTWSASIAPGVSTLAFWVAQQILDGHKDIPHDLLVPYLAFDQNNFEAALTTIPKGGVASHEYTLDEAKAAIASNEKK